MGHCFEALSLRRDHLVGQHSLEPGCYLGLRIRPGAQLRDGSLAVSELVGHFGDHYVIS